MALGLRFVLLLLVAVVVPATAQADKEQAKAHYERGKRLYNLSRFDDAVKEYEAAYLEMEDPAFLFNIGQCYRQLGKNELALRSYRNYVRSAPDAANRTDVENRIQEIEATLAKEKEATPAPVVAPSEPTRPVPVVVAPPVQEPVAQLQSVPEPAPADDGTNWWLWGGIGAGVVAVVLVAVLVSGGGTERPACPEGIRCF